MLKKELFTNRDIADYYNQTFQHYQFWWKLDQALSVHYGFWFPDTRSFKEALKNTDIAVAQYASIQNRARVLDAGCGVGGSAFYLAETLGCKVSGITLSEKQLDFAKKKLAVKGGDNLIDFSLQDYTKTSFPDASFDVVWAIESLTSCLEKEQFAKEAHRLLKTGGTLVLADYFSNSGASDENGWMERWRKSWSMAPIPEAEEFTQMFCHNGFLLEKLEDVTENIRPTSKSMYFASLVGALPSILYNNFFNVSYFGRNHYKSGYYQYKALKLGLWSYQLMLFRKKENINLLNSHKK